MNDAMSNAMEHLRKEWEKALRSAPPGSVFEIRGKADGVVRVSRRYLFDGKHLREISEDYGKEES